MNLASPFQKARRLSSADTTFPSRVPTVTEPMSAATATTTSQEVIEFVQGQGGNGPIPFAMFVMPFGLGAALDAFAVRCIGWKRIGSDPNLTLWVPFILGTFGTVLGTTTGVAGAPVINTEKFADTITIVNEPTITADVTREGTTKIFSPTGNLPGWFYVPLRGCEKIELCFQNTTNTPTKNALVSFIYDEC